MKHYMYIYVCMLLTWDVYSRLLLCLLVWNEFDAKLTLWTVFNQSLR